MKYILNDTFRLRGWYNSPTGLFYTQKKGAVFLPEEEYRRLMLCDGIYDILNSLKMV